MLYADVLLPLPMADAYTYSVPEGMEGEVQVGMRVVVPFGALLHGHRLRGAPPSACCEL